MPIIVREKVEDDEKVLTAMNDEVLDVVLGAGGFRAEHALVSSDGPVLRLGLIYVSHPPRCVESIHGLAERAHPGTLALGGNGRIGSPKGNRTPVYAVRGRCPN